MTTQTATGRHARTHLHIERVQVQPRWLSILSPFILIVLSLLVGAVLLRIIGADPWFVYRRMGNLAFGSLYGWSDTTIKATPLILASLGVSIAFRMRLWNIGAEGQLMIGAFFATGVALYVLPSSTPAFIMLTAMAIAGFIGGAFWGFIPGVLKAKLNVNEIITTLMLNYVAILWNNYFIYGPWSERGFGLTPTFPRSAWLPRFTDYGKHYPAAPGLTAHFGIFLAIGLAIVLAIVWRCTKWGFEVSIIGDNPQAAALLGHPPGAQHHARHGASAAASPGSLA